MFQNLGNIAADTLEKFREKKEEKRRQDDFVAMGKKLPLESFSPFGVKTEEEKDEIIKQFAKKDNREGALMLAGLAQQGQARMDQQQFLKFGRGSEPEPVGTSDSAIRDFFVRDKAITKARGGFEITDPQEFLRKVRNAVDAGELSPGAEKLAMNRFMLLQNAQRDRDAVEREFREKRLVEEEEKIEKIKKNTSDLRKEFNSLTEVKEFSKVRSAYEKVKEAGQDPSPAGDLSLIFNYMKILDPGSVVREGEFANAQNAGGIDTKVRNFYNNIIRGTRLDASQRQDFLNQSRNAAKAQFTGLKEQMDRYRGIAERSKLPVADILPENLIKIEEDLFVPITTPPDPNPKQDAKNRRMDATPSTQLNPSGPTSVVSPSTILKVQEILDKDSRNEPLTEKEKQLLELNKKKDLQNIIP
jgi:hypothetical protein